MTRNKNIIISEQKFSRKPVKQVVSTIITITICVFIDYGNEICFVKSLTASVAEARRRSEKPDINWNCRQRCLKKGYRRFSIGSGICKCIK